MKRILCPIDLSEFSRHALHCALAMAAWDKGRVIALHIFANWPAVDVVPSLRTEKMPKISLKDVDRAALRRSVEAFVASCSHGKADIDTRVEDAPDVHREILAQAEALRADLIVMGSHGRSGFERLLLGSITEKVLRKARCPVMVVPRRVESEATVGRSFKRILCPVDFSCGANAAFTRASELARKARAELTVLHVIETPAVLHEMPGFDIDAYRTGAEARSRVRLADLVPEDAAHQRKVIVAEGRTGGEILRVASELDVDLIVMGVHGRHAVDLMVFGSTTHEVIRGASCPVLTIRREESAESQS